MLQVHAADLPGLTLTAGGAALRCDAREWHAGRWWRGAEVQVDGTPYVVTAVTRWPCGEPVVLVQLARRPTPRYEPRPPGFSSPAEVRRRAAAGQADRPRRHGV